MSKITHTTNEGQNRDLNSSDSSSNVVFLHSCYCNWCLSYIFIPFQILYSKRKCHNKLFIYAWSFFYESYSTKHKKKLLEKQVLAGRSPDTPWWQRNTFNTCTSFAANSERKSAENGPTKRTKSPLSDTSLQYILRTKKSYFVRNRKDSLCSR